MRRIFPLAASLIALPSVGQGLASGPALTTGKPLITTVYTPAR